MQAGNSKNAPWRDDLLEHDARPITRRGAGTGRVEPGRDLEPIDDDLGTLNGDRWHEHGEGGA
jgi:hypothetical protein